LKNLSTKHMHFLQNSSDLGSVSGQSIWNMWWTEWLWGRFVYEGFDIVLPVNIP